MKEDTEKSPPTNPSVSTPTHSGQPFPERRAKPAIVWSSHSVHLKSPRILVTPILTITQKEEARAYFQTLGISFHFNSNKFSSQLNPVTVKQSRLRSRQMGSQLRKKNNHAFQKTNDGYRFTNKSRLDPLPIPSLPSQSVPIPACPSIPKNNHRSKA